MLTRLRRAVSSKLDLVSELAGLGFALSGASIAALVGKFFAAAVLGIVALGFMFRLSGRRAQAALPPPPTPPWMRWVAAALSAALVAAAYLSLVRLRLAMRGQGARQPRP
jgi:hypothetical protein